MMDEETTMRLQNQLEELKDACSKSGGRPTEMQNRVRLDRLRKQVLELAKVVQTMVDCVETNSED